MAIEDLIVQSGRQMSKDITEGWLGTPESRRQNRLDEFNMEQKRLMNLRNQQADQRAQEAHKQKIKHTDLAIQDIERRLKVTTTPEERKALLYQEEQEGNIFEGAFNAMQKVGPKAARDILTRNMSKFDEESQAEMEKLLQGGDQGLVAALTNIRETIPEVQDHLRKLKEAVEAKRSRTVVVDVVLPDENGKMRTYKVPITDGVPDYTNKMLSWKTPEQEGEVKYSETRKKHLAEVENKKNKVTATIQSLDAQTDRLSGMIDEAIGETSHLSAGLAGTVDWIPLTDAKDLRQKLETIKANIGFDKLAEMRANSPTGGALGQVSEFENRLLQAVNGSLDNLQKPKVLKKNLAEVKRILLERKTYAHEAFERDYGKKKKPTVSTPEAGDIIGGYRFKGGNVNTKSNWEKVE